MLVSVCVCVCVCVRLRYRDKERGVYVRACVCAKLCLSEVFWLIVNVQLLLRSLP